MNEKIFGEDAKKKAIKWLCSGRGDLFFVIETEGKYAIFYAVPVRYDIFFELNHHDKEKGEIVDLRLDSLEEVSKTLRGRGWVIEDMGNELGNFGMHHNPETRKIEVGFKGHSPILAKDLTKGDVLEHYTAKSFIDFWGGKEIQIEELVTVVG